MVAAMAFLPGAWHGGADRLETASGAPFVDGEITGRILETPEQMASGDTLLRLRSGGRTFRLKARPSPYQEERRLMSLRRGDLIRVWARTGLPESFANPEADSPGRSLRSAGIDRVGTVKSALMVERLASGEPGLLRWADQARFRLRDGLDRIAGADPDARGLLGAMLLGDRGALPPSTLDRLRSAGLVHLIAVSGLHVGLILFMVLGAFRRLPGPLPSRLVAKLLLLTCLVILIGGTASILRAAAMALIAGWGRRFGRSGEALNSLAAVGLLLVLWEPASVHNAGFQLSFAATAGIIAGYRPLRRIMPLPAFPGAPLAVSAAAYMATAPWAAVLFGTVVPGSLLSNLVSAPLCGLILLAGYPAMTLAALGLPTLGSGVLAVAACRWLIRLAELTPGSALQVPLPPLAVIACLLAAVPLLLGGRNGGRWRSILLIALFLGLTCLHLGKLPQAVPAGTLEVTLPDVGQGQAVLVRGHGGTVLVDAGGSRSPTFDIGLRVVAPQLARLGIHRLDVLAISHEHLDHAGGAGAILKRFEIGQLWIGPGTVGRPAIRPLVKLARERGVPVVLSGRGTTLRGKGWTLSSLHPGRHDQDLSVNDRSLVLRFETELGSVLLPGDLEEPGETRVVDCGLPGELLDAEVLVACHHGASGSSTPRFLAAVSPQTVLISAGRGNRFGHPDPGTMARFRATGAVVASTERDGFLTWRRHRTGWLVTGYTSGALAGTKPER